MIKINMSSKMKNFCLSPYYYLFRKIQLREPIEDFKKIFFMRQKANGKIKILQVYYCIVEQPFRTAPF